MENRQNEVAQENQLSDDKQFSQRALEEVQRCRNLAGNLGGSIHRDQQGRQSVTCQVVDSHGEIRNVLPPLVITGDGRPPREGHGRF